jgi:RND family efflux transporter MFP subunit
MRRRTYSLLILFTIGAVIALGWWYVRTPSDNKDHNAAVFQSPDLFKTGTPKRQDFTETCRWFGKVESRDKTRIIALETGMIVSIDAGDEMPVKKGALLFTIGGPLIESRLEVLRNKTATLQERVTLAERIVSIKQDAVSRKFTKYEELTSAEDALARLKAEMGSARQEMQRLQEAIHVRATIDGVFTNRKVSAGQEVQKGDNLAEIISLNHIYVVSTLFPQKDAELEGKQAFITPAGSSSISGTIVNVLPQSTAEGAVVVWIEGPALDRVLRPGRTVSGTVVLSLRKGALAVPQGAIVRDEKEQAYVFVKDPSGYHKRPVKTGIISEGWVEVMSGLKEVDEIVIRGAYELFYRDFNKIYKAAD